MDGHKKIWYIDVFTSLVPEINMVETFPFALTIFPGMH